MPCRASCLVISPLPLLMLLVPAADDVHAALALHALLLSRVSIASAFLSRSRSLSVCLSVFLCVSVSRFGKKKKEAKPIGLFE